MLSLISKPQVKDCVRLNCLMVYAFSDWIDICLCNRERYSGKRCIGQEQNDIGVVGRNSVNVEGWSVDGIIFMVFWIIFVFVGPKYVNKSKIKGTILEFPLFLKTWGYLLFQFKMKPQMHYAEDDCPVPVPSNFPKDDELHFEIELIDFSKVKARMLQIL